MHTYEETTTTTLGYTEPPNEIYIQQYGSEEKVGISNKAMKDMSNVKKSPENRQLWVGRGMSIVLGR